jgi:hypothetical protein
LKIIEIVENRNYEIERRIEVIFSFAKSTYLVLAMLLVFVPSSLSQDALELLVAS